MSDEQFSLHNSPKTRLFADITFLMLKGAGYAAVAVLVIWFAMAVLGWVAGLLPERSKQAPDPTPTSMLVIPADPTAVV